MHQKKGHCVPEGIFTCTVVATIYNEAEAKFVNGEESTDVVVTFRQTLEDGTPLAPGHFLFEHPSVYFLGTEMSVCALNPVIEGTTKCADVSDSTIYESKLNKDCTALEGMSYQTATATSFNEFPFVGTRNCEKKHI